MPAHLDPDLFAAARQRAALSQRKLAQEIAPTLSRSAAGVAAELAAFESRRRPTLGDGLASAAVETISERLRGWPADTEAQRLADRLGADPRRSAERSTLRSLERMIDRREDASVRARAELAALRREADRLRRSLATAH
jgi:hypothetical protein